MWAAPTPVLSPTAQGTAILGLFHFLLASFPRWISTVLEFPTSWSLLSFRLHLPSSMKWLLWVSFHRIQRYHTVPGFWNLGAESLHDSVALASSMPAKAELQWMIMQNSASSLRHSLVLWDHSLSGFRVPLMLTLGKHFPLHPFWSKESLWCILGLGTLFLVKLHIFLSFCFTCCFFSLQGYSSLNAILPWNSLCWTN